MTSGYWHGNFWGTRYWGANFWREGAAAPAIYRLFYIQRMT